MVTNQFPFLLHYSAAMKLQEKPVQKVMGEQFAQMS